MGSTMGRAAAMMLAGSMLAATLAIGAAAAEPAKCQIGQLLELKVTMIGRQPVVTVGIDGHDQRFIADSGAFYSSISEGAAAEIGLHSAPLPNLILGGIGGSTRASVATVKTVDLAGVPLHNVQFIVGGSEVGNGVGLLGQNVLGIGDVEYDLAHGVIRLLRPKGSCKDTALAYWAGNKAVSTVVIEPRDEHQRHTIGTVLVNGVKMKAVFDTGAASTVMSLAAAKRIGLTPDSPGVVRSGYGSGIGSKQVASYILPIDSIKLGDQEEIRRTHLRAQDLGMGDDDMLIGADFFLSHRVYVANGLHRLFFTYDGGPIFSTKVGGVVDEQGKAVTIAADTVAEPTDAAGYSRRGAAFLARHDLPHALADFDKAVALAPTDARYTFQRANAWRIARQPLRAMDDLDTTLKLDPANAEARLARASVRLGRHDRAAAEEDVTTVDKSAVPAADARLTLAGMYGALDQYDRTIGQYDLWLHYHPDDSRRPVALNGRCWARAQLGQDLGKALSDCDGAIRAMPTNASYLDSRGLVRLRMGDNERAIRDYDASLALAPRSAWSLYGRGLAEQRLGQKEAGQKDIDAATAIAPQLGERLKKIGVIS